MTGPPIPSGLGYLDKMQWFRVKNTTAETIPPGGAMRVTGRDADDNVLVAKPNASNASNILINRVTESILPSPDGFGLGTYDPTFAAVSGTPTTGMTAGTVSGSWLLAPGGVGLTLLTDAVSGMAEVIRTGGFQGFYGVLGTQTGSTYAIVGRSGSARDVKGATFTELVGMTVFLTPDPANQGSFLFGPYVRCVKDAICNANGSLTVTYQYVIGGP
jgi:hypothetical protein